jgi:hypothetical protein
MTPARLHAAIGVTDAVAAVVLRDPLVRGLLLALAFRHLGEAAVLHHPTRSRRRLAAVVDGVHGLTAVGWALRGSRHRGLGAISAALSAATVLNELPPRAR